MAEKKNKKERQSCCESCAYFMYDDEYECYVNLDEDEMSRFMSDSFFNCPYYKYGDEYSVVRKQM